jgi:hypothetical protein
MACSRTPVRPHTSVDVRNITVGNDRIDEAVTPAIGEVVVRESQSSKIADIVRQR